MLSRPLLAVHSGAVRCHGQAGAVAHTGRERLGGPAAGWHPHDRRPGRVRGAVRGRHVAGGADGEVHRAVGADRDALERMGVGAPQVGALRVGQVIGDHPWIRGGAVGVVVRGEAIALRHIQCRAGEGQAVRLLEAVEQHRFVRASAPVKRSTVPALGTETSRSPSGVQAASRGLGVRAHTDSRQPRGTTTCRGRSNGAAARPGATSTVTVCRSADGGADAPWPGPTGAGRGGAGASVHPASRAAPTSSAPIRVTRQRVRHASPRPGSPRPRSP